ncbi:MAG: alpha-L-fucosidase [Myxococcales bacterium]|nr:alpha-L-fucosidase [Myxococcales bacterium]
MHTGDSAPTPAQAEWMSLAYGMFLHFGPWTFSGVGDGKFPAERMHAPDLDMRRWARLAAESGMRYAVLTAKHVDGFCLWPSKRTAYSVAATPARRDLVADFVEAFRAEGLKVGLYYALLDRNCAFFEDDARYAEYMRDQVAELLTGYGEVLELWFDGAWDKDHPTRDWPHDPAWEPLTGARWEWTRMYEHIHRLQPRCLVIQNSSSDRPGVPNYLPVDARTSEHFDFVWREQLCAPRVDPVLSSASGSVFLPLEYCTTLTPGWFWQAGACYSHPSAETIAGWRLRAEGQGANLLLNVGPDTSGRIPDYHRPFLLDADRLVRAAHSAGK